MGDLKADAMNHLKQLVEEIGPRPTGSRENQAAEAYIEGVFEEAGLQVERQEFACPDWRLLGTSLNAGTQRYVVMANQFSPLCNVTAAPVALGTMAELEAADLNRHIVILYGDLTRETLSPKANKSYNPERHRKIIGLLEEKRPLAVITVNPTPHSLVRVIMDFDFSIPSATVPAEVGLALLTRAHRSLRLRIVSRRSPGQFCNVVGRLPGAGPQSIVLCAHFDTMLDTSGAIDNGSGTAALLALAKHFGGRELAVGLEFVAFNGEEGCGLGDEEYLRRLGLDVVPYGNPAFAQPSDALGHLIAAINIDGVGQYLGPNTIATVIGSQAFKDLIVGTRDEKHPGVVPVAPWPASNHTTFHSHGVPAVALTSEGVQGTTHEPGDTIHWMSPDRLAEAAALVADLVETLQDRTAAWARTGAPE